MKHRGQASRLATVAVLGFVAALDVCGQTAAKPVAAPTAGAPESADFFESKIRPTLASSCYGCHGESQLGGLRLDSREGLVTGGRSGTALVPGNPDKSLLITAVRQTTNLKMPMGGKLSDQQVADLVAWVKAGAVWPAASKATLAKADQYVITEERRKFWSFQPIHQVTAPQVKDATWAKTDIDRFVLAKLETEGLKPVGAASKRDLIRRATLDLIGIPPTPEEVAAFEKDESPDAYAKVVDRLLASPHYGERWGRTWLDVARYGEDDYRSLDPMRRGYNPYPNAFIYRDWVVRSFNEDLPYDKFVKAQLAGDLMDEKDRVRMLPATGFIGLGPWYYDNGAVEVTRADERNDRVDAVTRGFLGLTVACARCHDHKYDPIPSKDYYSLAGVFANTNYHEYPQAPKAIVDQILKYQKERDAKQKMLGDMQSEESASMAETLALQTSKYMQAAWEITGDSKKDLATVTEEKKLDYELLDRWVRFLAKPPTFYPYLKSWQEMIKRSGNSTAAKKLADEFQEKLEAVMLAKNEMKEENEIIAAKALPGTTKKKRANKPNEFITNDDFCPGCNLQLKTLPLEDMNLWTDVFQRDLAGNEDPAVQVGVRSRPGLLVFRGWALERRVGADRRDLMRSLNDDLDALRKKIGDGFPYLHGVEDSKEIGNIKVALRGSPYNFGDEVPRHFLSVLSPAEPEPFKNGSGRMELAEDIVKQPIAMRVIVNRIWKGHFGTGIVDTPSNFGQTGERPTNPDLLEYLANDFMQNGMSIKKLHREIMLSSVYQLNTDLNQHDFEADSGNRFYWRFNKRRMDAEQIRDSMLMVAGNLDQTIGGPSAELTPAYTRRTVYGKVSRYQLDKYLQLFDFPSPNLSAEKRFSSTVPLQRLFFMNADFMQAEAELMVKRTAGEADSPAKIRKLYQLAFNREPSQAEIELGLTYVRSEPMKEYEEEKARGAEKKGGMGRGGKKGADGAKDGKDAKDSKDGKDAKPDATDGAMPTDAAATDAPGAAGADGMMAGVGDGMGGAGRRRGPGAPATEVKYNATPWGRYAKVLLSSSEFLFVD